MLRSLFRCKSQLPTRPFGSYTPRQALANLMWATATLKKENDALIRHCAFVACKLLKDGQDFRVHEYSTMVWAMVITQAKEECLFQSVSGHFGATQKPLKTAISVHFGAVLGAF